MRLVVALEDVSPWCYRVMVELRHLFRAERRRPGDGRGDRGRHRTRHHRGVLRRERSLRIPRPAPRRDLRGRHLPDPRGKAARLGLQQRVRQPDLPGRKVPDLCGLVGMRPRAAYIMLPVQPMDEIDQDLAAGGPYPNGDQTRSDDGWAAISGTSAAAPHRRSPGWSTRSCSPGHPTSARETRSRRRASERRDHNGVLLTS